LCKSNAEQKERRLLIMPRTKKLRVMSKDQARAEARKINDQGVVEELTTQSVAIEQSLWDELKDVLNAEGTNISREVRRWATTRVAKR
jgi:hypothetical protein